MRIELVRTTIPVSVPTYQVSSLTLSLKMVDYEARCRGVQWDPCGDDLASPTSGFMKRIWVAKVIRGPMKIQTFIFYGRSDQLN
jgi:hypothetical protein